MRASVDTYADEHARSHCHGGAAKCHADADRDRHAKPSANDDGDTRADRYRYATADARAGLAPARNAQPMTPMRWFLRVLLTPDPVAAVAIVLGVSIVIPARLFALFVKPPYAAVYDVFPAWAQWLTVAIYAVQVASFSLPASLWRRRIVSVTALCVSMVGALMQGIGAPDVLAWVLWAGVAWVQLWIYWRLTLRDHAGEEDA